MICILQVGALVFGIIVLIKGEFSVTRQSVITGVPARVIGAILAAWLPVSLVIGISVGIFVAMTNPNLRPENVATEMLQYWWIDFVIGAIVLAGVVLVASFADKQDKTKKTPGRQYPPGPPRKIDSDNPYQPPHV